MTTSTAGRKPAPKDHDAAEIMRSARARLMWTQKDAAEALGLSIAQISAMENGRSAMTKTLRILLGAYATHHKGGIARPFAPITQPPA